MLLAAVALIHGCASAPPSSSTATPTIPDIADVSLAPAEETTTPEPMASASAVPSVVPPSDQPAASNEIEVDYVAGADDLPAFLAAYRAAFPGLALTDEQIEAAGARLCTYLMHHADADGSVAVEEALIEADLNEPGFARAAWLAAFEVANRHYCGEFTVDVDGAGG